MATMVHVVHARCNARKQERTIAVLTSRRASQTARQALTHRRRRAPHAIRVRSAHHSASADARRMARNSAAAATTRRCSEPTRPAAPRSSDETYHASQRRSSRFHTSRRASCACSCSRGRHARCRLAAARQRTSAHAVVIRTQNGRTSRAAVATRTLRSRSSTSFARSHQRVRSVGMPWLRVRPNHVAFAWAVSSRWT